MCPNLYIIGKPILGATFQSREFCKTHIFSYVFSHGENYRELEMMVDYGMEAKKVLQSATSVNAKLLHFEDLGQIKLEYLADMIAVEDDPTKDIKTMRNVTFVMKDGIVYKKKH